MHCPPQELHRLIEEGILELIDKGVYDLNIEQEEDDKQRIQDFIDTLE